MANLSLYSLPSTNKTKYLNMAIKAAPTSIPIFIQGESGVGKDILARFIHDKSRRKGKYVALNAAGLSKELAASELFGHAKGAFTGAHQEKPGAFMEAHQGTLFLDEIAELPLQTQAELLRAIESGKIRKVGETEEKPIDVRIITATHQNLNQMISAKLFREDLYYRLCVLHLEIPPLRQRPEDLTCLINHFVQELSPRQNLSEDATNKLHNHSWPGNIRELKNTLLRSMITSGETTLHAKDIKLQPALKNAQLNWSNLIQPSIIKTYEHTNRNVAQTAKLLGLRRSVVYQHVRRSQHTD